MKLKSSGSKQLLRVTTVVCLVVVILGDYYQDLQLEKGEDSTEKEIKKQFRILSKKYHPDVNPSDSARELYQKIQRAHEVLSDKRKKKMYDLRGEEGLKQLESNAQGSNMSDPFSAFFGAQNDGGQREQKIMNVDVSLEDMYIGRTMNISYRKQKLCRTCKGTGAASMDSFIKCSKCHGTGKVTARMQFGPFIQTVEQQCPQCAGKGKQVKHVCTVCKGHKVSSGTQVLQVEVERGIPEGHEVVYEMEADEYPDKIPADLKLVFKSRNHNRFVRDGNHLHTTLTISLKDSLVGFRKEIRHLDDHEVVITRDETTPYGTVIRLPGEGMPIHNIPSERGDLWITVKVTYPKYIPLEKRERLAELLSRLELHKS